MALKLSLKANEKLIIGGAVIRNGSHHTELYVENDTPILRQKDILTEKDANTPARRVYFALQLMYIDPDNGPGYREAFQQLTADIVSAAPSSRQLLVEIAEHVTSGRLYQALKLARHLIDLETELLSHAQAAHPQQS